MSPFKIFSVGHETTDASSGNKHFFSKQCHHQNYLNYDKNSKRYLYKAKAMSSRMLPMLDVHMSKTSTSLQMIFDFFPFEWNRNQKSARLSILLRPLDEDYYLQDFANAILVSSQWQVLVEGQFLNIKNELLEVFWAKSTPWTGPLDKYKFW